MIVLIVSLCVFIVFCYIFIKFKLFDGFLSVFCSLVLSFGLFASICGPVNLHSESEYVEVNRIDIYSLHNQKDVEGSFALGCGSIRSEMYFYYYVKSDFGYSIDKIRASGVLFAESDELSDVGYISYIHKELVNEDWVFGFGKVCFQSEPLVIIYLPKDSIQVEFNVGL